MVRNIQYSAMCGIDFLDAWLLAEIATTDTCAPHYLWRCTLLKSVRKRWRKSI